MRVLILIALLICVSGASALASATNWMVYLVTDSTNGEDFGVQAQIGVKPAASDNYDSLDGDPVDLGSSQPTTKWAGSPLTGGATSPDLYSKNFMSTAPGMSYPTHEKTWTFRVGGLSSSSGPIRLRFKTGASMATLPPAAIPTIFKYYLRLTDRKGKDVKLPTWAGGDGTILWHIGQRYEVPVPSAINTYFGESIFPELRVSQNDNPSFMTQGYEMQFIQYFGPEPGGLVALGSMLGGLALLARRRRLPPPR